MSVEDNKRVVLQYLASISTGTDLSLLCDDGRWWIPGRGYIPKAEIPALIADVDRVIRRPFRMVVDRVTAEEDRVAVEAHSEAVLADGRPYENTYHFLFLMRDGKILEQREHNDTAYAHGMFGALFQI